MANRVLVLLAGKAATDVIYNKYDVGCSSDLSRASRILNRFYEDFGIADFRETRRESGPKALDYKDDWIASQMNEYYIKTKELITNNKDELINIANYLISNKTIVRKDIKQILKVEEN